MRNNGRTVGSFGDATHSRCRYGSGPGRRAFKGLSKLAGTRKLISVAGGRVENSTPSGQKAANISMYTAQSGANSEIIAGSVDLGDMQTVIRADDPTTTVVVGASSDFPRRYWVKKIWTETQFKNQTIVPVKMTIYTVVARRDQQTYGSPLDRWLTGLAPEAIVPGYSTTMPGLTPFMSEEFVLNYRVVNVSKTMLHPGSSHIHHITCKPRRMQMGENNQDYYCLSGQSMMVLAVFEGQVINAATDKTQVNYAPFAIDYTTEYHAEFMSFEKSRTLYSFANGLKALTTAAVTVTEDSETNAAVITPLA
jgi:hypothetical protein